jgi:hypothetical protein
VEKSVYILRRPVRLRTSEGEASFLYPQKDESGNMTLVPLTNNVGGRWLKLPIGTEVTLCAAYHKTDTWMLAVQLPPLEEGGTRPPVQGMVLRLMSWDNLVAATLGYDDVVPEPADGSFLTMGEDDE